MTKAGNVIKENKNTIPLATAYRYLRWENCNPNILPVDGKAKAPGTLQHGIRWKQYQQKSITQKEYTALFKPHDPFDALGILNGPHDWRSLDFDQCLSTDVVFRVLELLGLLEEYPWVVETGSKQGFHIWIRCKDLPQHHALPQKKDEQGVFSAKGQGFDHLELRWERCQTLVPPSLHKSGNLYTFLQTDAIPSELPAYVSGDHLVNAFQAVTFSTQQPAKPTSTKKPQEHDSLWQHLKASVDPEKLFHVLEWDYIEESGNYCGPCPNHESESGTCLRWHIQDHYFVCFHEGETTCGAKGDCVDFVILFKKCSKRDAARFLCNHFAPKLLSHFQDGAEQQQLPENSPLTQEVLTTLQQTFQVVKDIRFDVTQHHKILQKYYELVQPNIDAQPQTVITPFLAALATNIGNKAYIQFRGRKHFCNIWCIIIARSTVGRKTTSVEFSLTPLRQWDFELQKEYKTQRRAYDRAIKKDQDYADEHDPPVHQHIILPTATSERFFQILQDNPNSIMVFSEIASLLTKLNKSYNSDLKSDMAAMFDVPECFKHETMTRSEFLSHPCFSIAAATTKEWLLKELDRENDIQSGFMQRFLVCNSHDIDFKSLDFTFKEGNDTQAILNNYLQRLYNNLRQIGSIDEPVELTFSEKAKLLYKETNEAIFKQLLQTEDNLLCSYAGRCFTDYFLRFSIIFTLAEYVERAHEQEQNIYDFSPYDLEVSEETARYVMKLCQFYFQNIASFLKNEIAENRELRNEKTLVRILEEKGKGEFMSRSDLKNFSNLRLKEFKEGIESLKDRGIIDELEGKKANNGQIPKFYRLNISFQSQ